MVEDMHKVLYNDAVIRTNTNGSGLTMAESIVGTGSINPGKEFVMRKVSCAEVNVRKLPDIVRGEVFTTLKHNTIVKVISDGDGEREDFSTISYKGETYYIKTEFLKEV